MKKLLVVADEIGWAFDRFAKGIKVNCPEYHVDILYLNVQINNLTCKINEYDLVYYLCDNYPLPLIEWVNRGLDKDKVILGVRSEVDHVLYTKPDMIQQVCGTLGVSNKKLYDRFKHYPVNVKLLEGGVDTDIFTYKERIKPEVPRIGWSGSYSMWGKDFRGLDIIESTCKQYGYVWNPALREVNRRGIDSMVKYYHDEIDIYVEMSISAGRQNGLIESGSTGVPIISFNSGISNYLIKNKENGILLQERNSEILHIAICDIMNNYQKYSKNIHDTIVKDWSWKSQINKFKDTFERITV